MSRKKKSRKPGSTGSEELIVTRNRSESDVEGRLRKRVNKRKGLKAGNRHSDSSGRAQKSEGQPKDPRHGSKKPISLVAPTKPNKAQRRLAAEQELEAIQNDAQLNVLVDRIEKGEKLGAGLQSYVDQKLDRLEILMKQLGLYEEDDDSDLEEVEVSAPEAASVISKKKAAPLSEDELLAQFENLDLNQFK